MPWNMNLLARAVRFIFGLGLVSELLAFVLGLVSGLGIGFTKYGLGFDSLIRSNYIETKLNHSCCAWFGGFWSWSCLGLAVIWIWSTLGLNSLKTWSWLSLGYLWGWTWQSWSWILPQLRASMLGEEAGLQCLFEDSQWLSFTQPGKSAEVGEMVGLLKLCRVGCDECFQRNGGTFWLCPQASVFEIWSEQLQQASRGSTSTVMGWCGKTLLVWTCSEYNSVITLWVQAFYTWVFLLYSNQNEVPLVDACFQFTPL